MSSIRDRGADALTPEERELLAYGRGMDPPPGAKDEVWAALAPMLPLGAPGAPDPGGSSPPPAAGASAAAKLSASVVVKSTLAIVAAGSIAVSAWSARTTSAPPARLDATSHVAPPVAPSAQPVAPPVAPSALPAPSPAPSAPPVAPSALPDAPRGTTRPKAERVAEAPAAADRPEIEPAAPEAPPSVNPPPAPADDGLEDETRALLEARRLLRDQRPAESLRRLDDARRRFPSGALGEERDALTIEALVRLGKERDARERLTAFDARYPRSPQRARLAALFRGRP